MLQFYGRIARRLQGARPLFGMVAGLGLVAFVALIFIPGVSGGPTYAFLAITIGLWSIFFIVLINQFAAPIPVIEPGYGFFARLKIRLRRAVLLMAALVLSVMALVILAYTVIAASGLVRVL
jgi:hypothetical protein